MIKTPIFPEYGVTARLIQIIAGTSVQDFKNTWNTIWGLRGTPQNTVDWTDPDKWISERLSGKDLETAQKIWLDSNKTVNPRLTKGIQLLMWGYSLVEDKDGIFRLTSDGETFVSNKDNSVTRKIDFEEGLIQILRQLSYQKGERYDLLDEWEEFTKYNSNIKQDSVIKDYLRRRLVNLIAREYVKRDGNTYSITDKGLKYLQSTEKSNPNPVSGYVVKVSLTRRLKISIKNSEDY